jgi:two-component system, LytTR family, sensor kinase
MNEQETEAAATTATAATAAAAAAAATMPKYLTKGLLIFGGWTLVALFVTAHQSLQNFYASTPVPVWRILSWHLVSAYAMAAVTPLILRLVERFPLDRDRFYRNLAVHAVSAVCIVLFLIFVDALILPSLGFPPNRPFESFGEAYRFLFLTQFPFNLSIYCAVLALVFAVINHKKFRERELRASQLETRLVQAQLHVLKMQLHPHFLFNTHNAISELIYKDPRAAERTLANLSDLLRLSLEKLEVEEVSLKQELEFIGKYLAIEQMRFRERLRVRMNIAPDALEAVVPTMILQPLIENAIRHGIAPVLSGGTIEISAARVNGRLHLRVADDGVGFPKNKILRLKHGIGLSNTRARLLRLYNEFSFDVERNGANGLAVVIQIPFKSTTKPEFSLNAIAP